MLISLASVASLLVACSGPSDDQVAQAVAEAKEDFPIITDAMLDEVDGDGNFPSMEELNLPPEIQSPEDETFRYEIGRSAAFSGGPLCNLSLDLTGPDQHDPIMLSDRYYSLKESVCDPAALAEVTAKSIVNRKEAEREFALLQPALEEFFKQAGFYPETLDQLEVDQELLTLSEPGSEATVHDYRYYPSDFGEETVCGYYLSVDFRSPEVERIQLRRDRCSRS